MNKRAGYYDSKGYYIVGVGADAEEGVLDGPYPGQDDQGNNEGLTRALRDLRAQGIECKVRWFDKMPGSEIPDVEPLIERLIDRRGAVLESGWKDQIQSVISDLQTVLDGGGSLSWLGRAKESLVLLIKEIGEDRVKNDYTASTVPRRRAATEGNCPNCGIKMDGFNVGEDGVCKACGKKVSARKPIGSPLGACEKEVRTRLPVCARCKVRLSNVDPALPAVCDRCYPGPVTTKQAGVWEKIDGPEDEDPLSEFEFEYDEYWQFEEGNVDAYVALMDGLWEWGVDADVGVYGDLEPKGRRAAFDAASHVLRSLGIEPPPIPS